MRTGTEPYPYKTIAPSRATSSPSRDSHTIRVQNEIFQHPPDVALENLYRLSQEESPVHVDGDAGDVACVL